MFTMRNKTVLFLFVLLFSSAIWAEDLFNRTGKQFYSGCLVINVNGERELVVGNVLTQHRTLVTKLGKEPLKVLWAGELEVIDGQVTRVNETAGELKRNNELFKDIEVPGTGIKNLQDFLDGAGISIKQLYFTGTEYFSYSEMIGHLEPVLDYVAYYRHDFGIDLSKIITTIDYQTNLTEAITAASNVIKAYEALKELLPELDTKEWASIKPYFEQVASGQIPTDKKTYNDLHMSFSGTRHEFFKAAEKEYNIFSATKNDIMVITESKASVAPTIDQVKELLSLDYRSLEPEQRKKVNALLTQLLSVTDQKISTLVRETLESRWNDLTTEQRLKIKEFKTRSTSYFKPIVSSLFDEKDFINNAKVFLGSSVDTGEFTNLAAEEYARLCLKKITKILNSWGLLKGISSLYFFSSDQAKILIEENGLIYYFYHRAELKNKGQRTEEVLALEVLRSLADVISSDIVYKSKYTNRSIDIRSFIENEKKVDPKLTELLKSRESFSREKNLKYIEARFRE
jgi:hypothetical protein